MFLFYFYLYSRRQSRWFNHRFQFENAWRCHDLWYKVTDLITLFYLRLFISIAIRHSMIFKKYSLEKLLKSLVKKSNPDRFILMIFVQIFGIHPIHVEQNLRLRFPDTLRLLKNITLTSITKLCTNEVKIFFKNHSKVCYFYCMIFNVFRIEN